MSETCTVCGDYPGSGVTTEVDLRINGTTIRSDRVNIPICSDKCLLRLAYADFDLSLYRDVDLNPSTPFEQDVLRSIGDWR